MQIPSAPTAKTVHASLPKKRGSRKRFSDGSLALGKRLIAPVGKALCCFLMPFPSFLGIPSPFAAAWIAATFPRGFESLFPLMGLCASILFRALWGIDIDLWQYVGCVLLLAAVNLRKRDSAPANAALAGLSMLPRALAAFITSGAVYTSFLSLFSAVLAYGVTLAMRRGTDALRAGGTIIPIKDRACAILIPLALIAALGYLRISVIGLGHVAAAACTMVAARLAGLSGGAVVGLISGLALSLTGHSAQIALCLSLGGAAAGALPARRRRMLACAMFMFGYHLALFVRETPYISMSLISTALSCVIFLLLPERIMDRARAVTVSTAPAKPGMENSFVQAQLEKWEKALCDMAQALPPGIEADEDDIIPEIKTSLCMGCAEGECGAWSAVSRGLEAIITDAPEDIDARVEALKGYGCIRESNMADVAGQLIFKRRLKQGAIRKAAQEREMTKTHILALAQTISRTRELTRGETLSDLQAVYRIKQAMREMNMPAELCYCRRVDGHLQAAIRAEGFTFGGKQPQKLIKRLEREDQLPLTVVKSEKGLIELEELPLYTVELGVAGVAAAESEAGVSGDSILVRQRSGGQFLLALSDGMGHGKKAHQESEKTLELLTMCMEAGYSRRQAITAVNGMMLSCAVDERFATVDLFDISLWTGEAISEKLGAAPSYIVRGNYLKRVEGSSLPLGILSEIAPTGQRLKLHSGDILIVISDGVSDAFPTREALETAILDSLYIQPQRMADSLLRLALMACAGVPADDMTVMALLIYDQYRSASGA